MKTIAFLFTAMLALASPINASAQASAVQRLAGATDWISSPQLGSAELQGKVVLVDFWTYTCINWIRTLPYVRAWSEKYKDQGLVVIGVHTPEFEFEKQTDNVRRAVSAMRVAYPVALDSEYTVWRAFSNNAWPAIYLIDAKGRVRYSHLGEGAYEETERMIQQLLAEAGRPARRQDLVAVEGSGAEAAADWSSLRSPENYLGSERTENFSSPGGAVVGKAHMYAAPGKLAVNRWALAGDWTMQKPAITSNKPNARIVYRFHARDLHLVMGPATRGAAVRFRVLVDGKPPGAARGVDLDENGNGTVTEQRMYQLIRQQKPVVERLFEIEFIDPGIEAFSFTFG